MSTGSSTQSATRRGGLSRLRDARIRSKLALILLVPLLAVVALAAVRLIDVGTRALDANRVEKLTRLATDLSGLTQSLHNERMAAAIYLATPISSPRVTLKEVADAYNAAVVQTDSQEAAYKARLADVGTRPAAVQNQLDRIDGDLQTLDNTRKLTADRENLAVADVVGRYGVVITDVIGYGDLLSQYAAGDDEVADGLRALAAFSRAKAGTANQEAVAYAAQVTGDRSDEQLTAFIATETSQQEALLAFSLVASPAQRALVDSTVTGDAVNLADQLSTDLIRKQAVAGTDIVRTYGAVVDLMRWAERRLETQSVDAATAAGASVTRQATIESILVLLVLAVAILLAVLLARTLNSSLRRLREGALAVANRDLPDAVARLRDVRNLGDGGADDIVRSMRDPIQMSAADEVGQVAQAFNVVHREAVRIAAEQAALRTSVSAMFLNLARRSQSLVDRMIGELDQIERGEEDPKRLAQLFELDHLATRMRRNDENLLVLAGADSSAPRREDALLVDALRAAQSEVELYNRVEFGTVDTDISITALAVNDVVRLIAELLDNATRFSPPNSIVVADGRRIRDYVVIQIEDRGLGMSEDQMDALNRRLSEPPSVDVAAFRLMGLAVVGRLASRYGIRVELRANLDGGTVAQVILPNAVVVLPGRTVEPPMRGNRPPQLDSGPTNGGWHEAMNGRSSAATATLPALTDPEPWQPPAPQHPALPQMPSQRPALPRRGEQPVPAVTPERPPLPTRVAQPVAQPITSPLAQPLAQPVGDAGPAVSSPTMAYPVVQPAVPELQVAVGFITPDGKKIPPPATPEVSGWGAALAAMPPAPAPPAAPSPAPAERAEAPIFLQMQANWFKGQDGTSPDDWSMPTAGKAPAPMPAADGGAEPAQQAVETPAAARVETPAAARVAAPAPERVAPPVPEPQHERVSTAAAEAANGQNGARPASAGSDNGASQSVPRPRTSGEDHWRTAADDGWQRAMAAAAPPDAGTTRSGLPKRVPQAQLVPGGVQTGNRSQNKRSPDEVRGLLSAYHRGVQRGRTAGSAEAEATVPKENRQ